MRKFGKLGVGMAITGVIAAIFMAPHTSATTHIDIDVGPVAVAAAKPVTAAVYKPMTFEEFKVDGAELVKTREKVIITAFYSGSDRGESLKQGSFADPITIGLLTNDASRETRLRLLKCRSNPVGHGWTGCDRMTIIGHAVSCTRTNAFGVTHEDTCIAVEDSKESK